MNEPWMTNYRGLAVVPMTAVAPDGAYTASYKVVTTLPDGTLDTVTHGDCDGSFATVEDATEAADDAGRLAADRLLDAAR